MYSIEDIEKIFGETYANDPRYDSWFLQFKENVDKYYDAILGTPIEKVKELLPPPDSNDEGDYMYRFEQKNGEWVAEIWDWYGDRSTTRICYAKSETEDSLCRILLMKYMNYLVCNRREEISNKFINAIKNT